MQFLSDQSDTSQDQPQQPKPVQHLANMAGSPKIYHCSPIACNLFVSSPNKHLKSYWVIDTGATNYFIRTPLLFSKSTPVTNSYVQLPNRTKAQVTHISQVRLFEHIILHNVLLVPSFSYNLLSASKLTSSSTIALVVLRHLCFLQDLSNWKTIGIARIHAGLFWLLHQPIQGIMSSGLYQQKA
ncbi:hypothetical protein L6164_028503 [Bauhinia variegata]|uniref:Uncharacterized protein n=1 Tax=Bauhinia variegata TaxID=167791 RepID=A0ACB9L664_BAUVA|nr:hypothetical protein L6164_028503 [Bauhinia variegata]